MKNINKNNQLKLANTSSDAKLELKEEEMLEKKLLEILENHNFEEEEEGYCPSRFCESGATPDWYIIYENAKDREEGTKFVEYYFKLNDKVIKEYDHKLERRMMKQKFRKYKEKWNKFQNELLEKDTIKEEPKRRRFSMWSIEKDTIKEEAKIEREYGSSKNINEIVYDNKDKAFEEKPLNELNIFNEFNEEDYWYNCENIIHENIEADFNECCEEKSPEELLKDYKNHIKEFGDVYEEFDEYMIDEENELGSVYDEDIPEDFTFIPIVKESEKNTKKYEEKRNWSNESFENLEFLGKYDLSRVYRNIKGEDFNLDESKSIVTNYLDNLKLLDKGKLGG